MCLRASQVSTPRPPRFMCVIHESADLTMLMIIMMAVFIYLQVSKKKKENAQAGLNECSVGRCREPNVSQEERGSVEDGEWGRGVNSSLCWEREKREALVVCLHVRESPLSLIKSVYVGLHTEILGILRNRYALSVNHNHLLLLLLL